MDFAMFIRRLTSRGRLWVPCAVLPLKPKCRAREGGRGEGRGKGSNIVRDGERET